MRGLILLAAVLSAEPAVEDREPPLVFYFETSGADGGVRRVPVELDKSFLTAELGKSATLKVEPTRRFAYAGVELAYPREFGFEAELEDKFASWTLSGNDCKVVVQRFKGQKKPEPLLKEVVSNVMKAYGEGKSKQAPVKLAVLGKTLEGTRVEAELAASTVVQEFYPFRSGGDVVVLILQDSPKKAGEPSPERVRVEALLRETLKLPAAAASSK